MLVLSVGAALTMTPAPARAAEPVLEFESAADEARYAALLEGYRCLKCQNQNLADSNAALAGDLRDEIYRRVVAGDSDAAIDDYLLARYGDFVLYRPRFRAATALLWIGPFVLLGVALVAAVRIARRAEREPPEPASDSLAEARRLLGDD